METNNAGRKQIWMRLLIGFFIVMALLTFFSATISNFSKPRVTVGSPTSAALQKVVVGSGSFAPRGIKTVGLDFTCKVDTVDVTAGDPVKTGDTLLTLDQKSLSEQLKTEQDNLAKLKNNRKKTENSLSPQNTAQLRIQLDEASIRLQQAQKNVDYVQGNVSSGTGTQHDLDLAKFALQLAQDDVSSVQSQLDQALNQNSKASQSNKMDLANANIDIAAQQKKVEELQTYTDNGGKIISPIDGVVQQMNAKAGGTVTPADPALTLTDVSLGLEFCANVSNDDAGLIPAGAQVDINLSDGIHTLRASLQEKKDSADKPGQMTTLVLNAESDDLAGLNIQPEEAADIRFTQLTQNYSITVPNSAVRQDSTGDFVLVVRETDTPLGKQKVLRSVPVAVTDSDEFRSAIEGPIGPGDQVVSGSDKPVADGDAVLIGS